MYVPFDTLPEESKIWIYQSNRKFSDEELTAIEADLREWLNLGDEVIIEADGEKIGYNGVAYFFKLRSADTWRYKGTCRVAYIKLPFDLSLMKL